VYFVFKFLIFDIVQNKMSFQHHQIYLYKRLVQAKLFIDRNFADKIELNNIAGEACFSKFHFIRLFKNVYGKTPHHYLTQVRIEHAKTLLTENISIAEVGSSVGFESMTSFTGLFKRVVGLTPSLYQQRQLRRKTEIAAAPLQFIPNCFAQTHGWSKK
jgi:AraC-like DNA-binding protein